MPFNLTRSYNSLSPYTGVFGHKWYSVLDERLVFNGDGSVGLQRKDGALRLFQPGGSPVTYRHPDGYDYTLTTQSGFWTLKSPQGDSETFDSNGIPVTMADRNSNKLIFANSGGLIRSISDGNGRTVTFTYNGSGFVQSMTDPISRSTYYYYNGNDLGTVLYPGNRYANYTYTGDSYMVESRDPAYRKSFHHLYYEYDGLNRVTKERDEQGNTVLEITQYGSYFSNTQTTYSVTGGCSSCGSGGNGGTCYFGANGLPTSIVDAGSNPTTFAHNSDYDRTKSIDANGHGVTTDFDTNGNALTITNFDGTSKYTYNSTFNLPTTFINAAGSTYIYVYDSNGNLLNQRGPLNSGVTYTYNSYGDRLTSKDANSQSTTYTYDSYGNLATVADPDGHTTYYNYDAAGRLSSVQDAKSNTTYYSWDAADRLVQVNMPGGVFLYYSYDENGNRLSQTDGNHNTTFYAYDVRDRLVEVDDPQGGSIRYNYDSAGNMYDLEDAKHHHTTFVYDSLNRLTSQTDPLSRGTTYTYDSVGNIQTRLDANGQTTQYVYDAANRPLTVTYPDNSKVINSYDSMGNLTSRNETNLGTATFAYDVLNRMTRKTDPFGNGVTFTYDPVGNPITINYPDGTNTGYIYTKENLVSSFSQSGGGSASYSYDSNLNPVTISFANAIHTDYSYDSRNQPLSITSNGQSGATVVPNFNYTYDGAGNRVTQTRGVSQSTYKYDFVNQLTYALVAGGSSGALTQYYTYDAAGNRIRFQENHNVTLYNFDDANQLTSKTLLLNVAEGIAETRYASNTSENDPWTKKLLPWNASRLLVGRLEDLWRRFKFDIRTGALSRTWREMEYWPENRFRTAQVKRDNSQVRNDADSPLKYQPQTSRPTHDHGGAGSQVKATSTPRFGRGGPSGPGGTQHTSLGPTDATVRVEGDWDVVDWQAPIDGTFQNPDTYRIYRSAKGTIPIRLGEVPATRTRFVDFHPIEGNCYLVRAVKHHAESPDSNIACLSQDDQPGLVSNASWATAIPTDTISPTPVSTLAATMTPNINSALASFTPVWDGQWMIAGRPEYAGMPITMRGKALMTSYYDGTNTAFTSQVYSTRGVTTSSPAWLGSVKSTGPVILRARPVSLLSSADTVSSSIISRKKSFVRSNFEPSPGICSFGNTLYEDFFSTSDSLGLYDYFDMWLNSASASSIYCQISNGQMQDAPVSGEMGGGIATFKDSVLSHGSSDYIVEGDFEMDSRQGNMGVFGLVFRAATNGSCYSFQYNGNYSPPVWEIEKLSSSGSTWPGNQLTSPAYTLGSWIHMKVMCKGSEFVCYVNFNDGQGDQLMYDVVDNSMLYATGGAGIRTYGINYPNTVKVDNLKVSTCLDATPTPCAGVGNLYYDDFSDPNTFGNYGFMNESGGSNPAFAVTLGNMLFTPVTLTNSDDIGEIRSSLVDPGIQEYTVEGDFSSDEARPNNPPVMGVAFRVAGTSFYSFQWNGLSNNRNGQWELEKGPGASYLATSNSTAYSLGTTIHLKAVCRGNNFKCYLDRNDGNGVTLLFNVNDSSYPTGLAGFRAFCIYNPYQWHVDNLRVDGCGGLTTPTITATPTVTPTATGTPQVTNYTYDSNGNLTKEVTSGGGLGTPQTITYSYNYENRLTKIVDVSGNATTYVYDYSGNLLKMSNSSGATTYVYGFGVAPLEEMSSAGNQHYVQANGRTVMNNTYFFHEDALGNVAALSKRPNPNQGSVVRTTTYDPYGKIIQNSASVTYSYEYVGGYGVRDISAPSGSRYIMGVRMYDPTVGRFTSGDPLGFKADSNFFRYARNNPNVWVDPSGLDTYLQNRSFEILDPILNGYYPLYTWQILSHTFVFTTDSSGNLSHTYSWGNGANLTGWSLDQAADIEAAKIALSSGVGLNRQGDSSLDPYIQEAFNKLNQPNLNHANGIVCQNCKTEGGDLIKLAIYLRDQDRKNQKACK